MAENLNQNLRSQPILEIGEKDFEAEVLNCHTPVLVAFWASWSRPCQVIGSVVHELASSCAGKCKLIKVNADDNPELSLWYEVQSIPTLLYFLNGQVVARIVGTASKEAILAKLVSLGGTPTQLPSNPDSTNS